MKAIKRITTKKNKYRLLNLTPFSVSKRKLMEKKLLSKNSSFYWEIKVYWKVELDSHKLKHQFKLQKKVLALGDTTW